MNYPDTVVLGIDLETTGTDPNTCEILEVAGVLWSIQKKTIIEAFSGLNYQKPQSIPEEAEAIHGISKAMMDQFGRWPVLQSLEGMAQQAIALVAHNANGYEKIIIQRELEKAGAEKYPKLSSLPWIDTMTDVPYPANCTYLEMMYLAAYHGFVNPFPHRALPDVLAMLMVLSHYNILDVMDRALSPMIEINVECGFEGKDKAKALGARFNGAIKEWVIKTKACLFHEIDLKARELNVEIRKVPELDSPPIEVMAIPTPYQRCGDELRALGFGWNRDEQKHLRWMRTCDLDYYRRKAPCLLHPAETYRRRETPNQ